MKIIVQKFGGTSVATAEARIAARNKVFANFDVVEKLSFNVSSESRPLELKDIFFIQLFCKFCLNEASKLSKLFLFKT